MTNRTGLLQLPPDDTAAIPCLFAPRRFSDSRGWFCETYNERTLRQRGISCRFIQDNQSHSIRMGTVRGLHFQKPPFAQAKLVRVLRGRIFDVAVDIRLGSPTYGRYVAAELSAENGHQIYVPVGFAHGFFTLEDDTEVAYKVSESYCPAHESGIRWNDTLVNVNWPLKSDAIVSDKDANLPPLDKLESPFRFAGGTLRLLTLAA